MESRKAKNANIQEEVIGDCEKEKVDEAWKCGGVMWYPQQNTFSDRFPWGMFNKAMRAAKFTRQLYFAGT